jgi:hypothetical protein
VKFHVPLGFSVQFHVSLVLEWNFTYLLVLEWNFTYLLVSEWNFMYLLVLVWNFTYPLVSEWNFTYLLVSEWNFMHLLVSEWNFTYLLVAEWNFTYLLVSEWNFTHPLRLRAKSHVPPWLRSDTSRTPSHLKPLTTRCKRLFTRYLSSLKRTDLLQAQKRPYKTKVPKLFSFPTCAWRNRPPSRVTRCQSLGTPPSKQLTVLNNYLTLNNVLSQC